jgi:predicted O-linked N-acetylglucosamine transferase (SPINDLY family)
VGLQGRTQAGRTGLSLLSGAGLGELVASDEQDYVAKAAALGQDLGRLRGYRESLRGALSSSALCDAPGFGKRFEGACRELWRAWCAKQA